LDIDLAAVVVDDRCAAPGGDHNGIADLGVDPAIDRLIALALIDGKVALGRFNRGS
jgi:hypothetical protein